MLEKNFPIFEEDLPLPSQDVKVPKTKPTTPIPLASKVIVEENDPHGSYKSISFEVNKYMKNIDALELAEFQMKPEMVKIIENIIDDSLLSFSGSINLAEF